MGINEYVSLVSITITDGFSHRSRRAGRRRQSVGEQVLGELDLAAEDVRRTIFVQPYNIRAKPDYIETIITRMHRNSHTIMTSQFTVGKLVLIMVSPQTTHVVDDGDGASSGDDL